MQNDDLEEQKRKIREDISMEECNAFFFMKSGGFRSLVNDLGIDEGEMSTDEGFKLLVKMVLDKTGTHKTLIERFIKEHSFRDHLQMAKACMACQDVQESFSTSTQFLTQAFIEDGIDPEDAEVQAINASVGTMTEMYSDRDEELKMAVPVKDNAPQNAPFDQIFK